MASPSESLPAPDSLARALAPALGAVTVEGLERLTGGASRETLRFDAVPVSGGAGVPLVLRRDPPGRPSVVGAMTNEALGIAAAGRAGLRVPEVLVHSEAPSPWDTAGMVMRRVPGETLARRILRDDEFATARSRLAADCGTFLAGLHALGADAVPGLPRVDPLLQCNRTLATLDDQGGATPTLALAARWLAAHPPPDRPPTVVHGDFRLGNLIVGPEGLAAALDWELVHLGNPVEDLGWLCVKAWRFGAGPPVGGFGSRDDLLAAYRAAGGADVSLDELRWWEVLNTYKWGIGCMGQGAVHRRGMVRSVELAAIGRRVCEQEWDLLLLLCPDAAARHRDDWSSIGAPEDEAGLHGRPTRAELLDAVEGWLRADVVTGVGRNAFMARVAANVVAMVAREDALASPQSERRAKELSTLDVGSEAALATAVTNRAIGIDDPRLHDVLASGVGAKLAVANPRYLTNL